MSELAEDVDTGFSSTFGACLLHEVTANANKATAAAEQITFFILYCYLFNYYLRKVFSLRTNPSFVV